MFRIALSLIVGLPLVVYFVLGMPISAEYPELKGFNFRGGISIIPELAALVLALSIYTASFIAEIVRSGINAVSHGQTEAAMSLGLPRARTLKLVIIPQALRIIIPPLTSQYLNLTENSSLAMAIGYPDLVSVFAGTTLNQTGQAIEIIAMTMGVYLSISPDAHRAARLVDYRLGAELAQGAGLCCGSILNTLTATQMRRYLARRRLP